jgi:uncharacterized Zn-finger protein
MHNNSDVFLSEEDIHSSQRAMEEECHKSEEEGLS